MRRYRCLNCGYSGPKLIYQFTDYTYCVASNDEDPQFIDDCPVWVRDKGLGEAEIGEPVGCPKCHAWGTDRFEVIRR